MQAFSMLIVAQTGVGASAAPASAPSTSAPATGQAVVPLGLPTPSKQGTEGQAIVPATTTPATPAQKPPGMDSFMWIILPFFAIMIFMMWNNSRSEKKKKAELNSSLKKGDTVQMLGGIIGVVSEIRDDEVVVKMEEGRIRFAKSAIQGILKSKDGKADATLEAKALPAGAAAR